MIKLSYMKNSNTELQINLRRTCYNLFIIEILCDRFLVAVNMDRNISFLIFFEKTTPLETFFIMNFENLYYRLASFLTFV